MLFEPIERYFRTLGHRGRTVMFQLPLSVTMLLVTVLAWFLHPQLQWSGPFLYTLAAHLVLLAACVLIPWERLPRPAVLVIPVLDCLAVGFSRDSADQYLGVLGFLLVFPVVWLSVGRHPGGIVIAIVAAELSAVLPPVILGTGLTSASFIRIALLPVIFGAVALTTHGVANAISRQRRLLEDREIEVRELLNASEHREQLLGTVLDTVSVGVCALDDQGRTILVNHHLSSHLAQSLSASPAADQDRFPVYGTDREHPLPPELHPRTRAARGQAFTDELIWFGTGSRQRAYSATCRLMKKPDGQHAGAVLAFTDVTSLVEALSAKDQFVASVSHELRTPLTSILGYLALALDEKPLDPDMHHYLTVAKRNAERLLNLVGDLLTIAGGALTVEPRQADLAEVAAHSVEAAQPKAKAGGINLSLETEGQATGRFDPDRIGQAIDNLISNAVKYTPKGGAITVRVSTTGNQLSCEVTDTGVGMTEDELAQAFTRFFRSASSHSSAIPGAGLGLAITKTIIENHRGNITLLSSAGEGTTAAIALPGADTEALSMAST